MITSIVKNLPQQTAEIEIHIPWTDIKTTFDEIFSEVVSQLEISGFRKGKAPKSIAEKHIDKTKVYEQVVQKILPKAYADAVKEHNLKPISNPKLEIIKARENEEWVIKTTIALFPKVILKEYKKKIQDLKKSKIKIWVPGKETKNEKPPKPSLDELVKAITDEADVEMSDILLEQEANRLLSDLIDQTKKLGMTVEQYLMAKGKTSEQLRQEYQIQARKNLSLEFTLNEIADQEKIEVTQKDIDDIIAKVEKDEEREKLKKDSYYLAHLIRQQKTLDFLNNL